MWRLNRGLTAVGALALLIAGCAVAGPDFKSPDAPAGAAATGYAMAGDAAPAGVRLDPNLRAAGAWWQAFGNADLDRTVRLALAESPTVAEAKALIARAEADAQAARGALSPQGAANAGLERERINTQAFGFSGFPSPTINLYSVGAGVTYDLDLFGGGRRAAEAAGARAEMAAREADAAYLTLSGNVALQAMRVAGLRGQIAAVRATLEGDRQVADIVRRAQAAGGQAPAATNAVAAQLAEDEALLPPLQRELDLARHQLALLAGRAPAEWTAPDFDLDGFTPPTDLPLSLPSALVHGRPDILAAEAQLHVATARIGVAVADQYPDIRLSAALTQSAIRPGDLFGYDASGWSLGGGLAAPLFNGGVLKARRRAAEADAQAAQARYRQTVLRAFVQVSDALAAVGADQQRLAALSRASDAADFALRDAQSAYRLGGGALLPVVDAQRQVSRARRAWAEARGQYLEDLVRLFAATADGAP